MDEGMKLRNQDVLRRSKWPLLAVIGAAILFNLPSLKPLPARERMFLSDVEAAFRAGDDVVMIAPMMAFHWDSICISRKAAGFSHEQLSKDEAEQHRINRYPVVAAFFQNGRLIGLLGYHGNETIKIGNSDYLFAGFASDSGGYGCASNVEAALEIRKDRPGQKDYITITRRD